MGWGTSYIISRALIMFACIGLMIVGGIGGHFFSIRASVYFSADLRKGLFKKVQGFSFRNIDKFSTGSLVTRLTNDITQIQNMLRMLLIMAMRAPGMLIGGFIMAFNINASLAAVLAVLIPLIAVVTTFVFSLSYPRFEIVQKQLDGLNSSIQENITNVRVIKSFVRQKFEKLKFDTANDALMNTTLHAFAVIIIAMPLMTLAMNVTTVAVVWVGGRFVINGTMGVGELTAFTTYIVQILMSLVMFSMLFLQMPRTLASSKRVKEVLGTESDISDDNAKHKDKLVTEGRVEFRNVSFKYYENRKDYILDHIDLTFEPGKVVGIIGTTGSGKSSLVQLIPRLYDAMEGEVLVDGVNVRDYSLYNLREGVGMVLQKNVLFSGSVIDNLRWGDENATEEEIRAAAAAAHADGFIRELAGGYDMELGQGGVNVSGGQKQRLCIARTLLKKPKILILDDSTSAVDTATEARIREAFHTSLKDSTKIIIAQRITSVIDADMIVVLEDGRVAGVGTHKELMKSCNEYRDIYYSQVDAEKEVS